MAKKIKKGRKKKENPSWLPQIKLDTFVYYDTLWDIPGHGQGLAQDFMWNYNFNSDFFHQENFSSKLDNALELLRNMRDSEKEKEQQAMQQQIKKIESKIKKTKNETLQQKLKKQKSLLEKSVNIEDFSNMEEEYILSINALQQDAQTLERRLKELNLPKADKKATNTIEFGEQSRVEQFLDRWAETPQDDEDKVIQFLKKAFLRKLTPLINKSKNPIVRNNPQIISSFLLIQFDEWLTKTNETHQFIKTFSEQDITTLKGQLTDFFNDPLIDSSVIELLKTNESQLIDIINNFISYMGIEYLDSADIKAKSEAEIKEEKDKLLQLKNRNKEENKTLRRLKAMAKAYNRTALSNGKVLTMSPNSSITAHGFWAEFNDTLKKQAINISANVGIDLLTVTITLNNDENRKRMQQFLSDMNNIISDAFTKQKTITYNTLQDAIKNEKETQQNLIKAAQNAYKDLKKEKGDERKKFFVTHESLKMYKEVEEGKHSGAFTGREMNITSILTKLFAAAETVGIKNLDFFMDKKTLITFLINIDDLSLGHENKEPLELYFSLFAGLLMFDDITNLCKEAYKHLKEQNKEQKTRNNSIDQLHVYKINSIYFPISVILDNTIKQFESIQQFSSTSFTAQKTAIATLTIKKLKKRDKGTSTKNEWEAERDESLQSLRLQIFFLSSFSKYVKKLYELMEGKTI